MREAKKIFTLIFLLLAIAATTVTIGQPEPSSPEEEWYPPAEVLEGPRPAYSVVSTGTGVPGAAGAVSLQVVDEGGRVRREVYGSERFCL